MRKLVIAIVVAAIAIAVVMWQQYRPLPGSVAVMVNNTPYPAAAVDLFVQLARKNKPDIPRRQVVDGLIENQLLTEYGQRQHQGETHHDGGSGLVAYSRETHQENELFRLLRSVYGEQINASLKQRQAGNPSDLLVSPLTLDAQQLAPMLTLAPGLYTVMNDEQQQAARHLVLGRVRLASSAERDITLWDIYSRQNIQLKVQLHEMNLEFLQQAVYQYVATAYVIDWFEHRSGLTVEARDAVNRMVMQRLSKDEVMHELGMMQDIHDENEQLKALAEQVSPEEISNFYMNNRDAFRRVEKVRARHIRLDSQDKADKVFREINQGLPFDEAVRKYSSAADAANDPAGELGWIERHDRNTDWLRGLAFVQPEGRVSPPFRSPAISGNTPYWEILLLDEKVIGYQPPDSEGVRYEASRAIARQKLADQTAALRQSLFDNADIRYNQRYLDHE